VVRMCGGASVFCGTAKVVPTASSQLRYMCLSVRVLTVPIPADLAAFLQVSPTASIDHGNRPMCAGEANIQSFDAMELSRDAGAVGYRRVINPDQEELMPSAKKKSSKPTTCPECGGMDLAFN
jgi:hypothetical protein